MLRATLRWFIVLASIVSLIGLIIEPGIDSLLTLLGSIIALLTMLAEQSKTVGQATRDLTEQYSTKNVNAEPSVRQLAIPQSIVLNLTKKQQKIVANLQIAFLPIKSLLPIVSIVSVTFWSIFIVMMVLEADEIAFVFVGSLWVAAISIIYTWQFRKWYRRLEISDFYSLDVHDRKKVKVALCKLRWGNTLLNWYMYTLVYFLLKTNRNDAKKAKQQHSLW